MRTGRIRGVIVAAGLGASLVAAAPASAAPAISSFTPLSGPVGTVVTINGSGFSPAPAYVLFNGVPASNPSVNPAGTQIKARVPPFATSGKIRVSTAAGASGESPTPFRVTFGAALLPSALYVGQQLRISGSAYPPHTDVTFRINGTLSLGGTATDGNGNFSAVRTVPDIAPGSHQQLIIACASATCAQVQLPFGLAADWPQNRYDPAQTGWNSLEWRVAKGSVGKYHRLYDEIPALAATTGMVEKGGRLFYGGGVTSQNSSAGVLFSLPVSGKGYSWTASFNTPVAGLAAGSGVVYVVTQDTLYAFDANGKTNCSDGACGALWTAYLGTKAFPTPPVVWLGKVLVASRGTRALAAFDAAGVTSCSGNPKSCAPLWSRSFNGVFGAPAASSDGRVYLAAVTSDGKNRVVAYNQNGGFVAQSAPLAGPELFGPALDGTAANGSLAVTEENPFSLATWVQVLDGATLASEWSSQALGGAGFPSLPTVSGGNAYVANSDGRLFAFALGGCGASTCAPAWTSQTLGTGNSVAPIVVGGVVFHAANAPADSHGLAQIYAFDAAGSQGCVGTPKVCQPLADIVRGLNAAPGSVGGAAGMLIAGGVLYGVGGDGWTAFGM